MSHAITLNQTPSVRLSIEGSRAVMIRRGCVIRALRRRINQLTSSNVRLDQDLDEANAYIAELENKLDAAEEAAERWRALAGGAPC